jgi:hypothetical protein
MNHPQSVAENNKTKSLLQPFNRVAIVILFCYFQPLIVDDSCWTGERQIIGSLKQLEDESLKMSADDEDNAKCSGGLAFILIIK